MLKGKKIRILHLVDGLGVGGAEVLIQYYIEALPKSKYDHFVYYFGVDGPIRERIENMGITVQAGKKMGLIKHPISFGLKLLSLMMDLRSFIRSKRIQVIQSHLRRANQLAIVVGKLTNIPTFPTVHNTMAFVDRRSRFDPRVYIMKSVDAIVYRMAIYVIAVSEEVKRSINNQFKFISSKVVVLKNGIVCEDNFKNTPKVGKNMFKSGEKFRIIAVGRLVDIKCHDVLVKAVSSIVSKGIENIVLIIIGDGPEYMRLQSLIKELKLENYVKLLGMRNDVFDLMKNSDVFAMPSRYEGLSIAMIEAMACGLSIVASNAPGLRTYIIHKKNGLLFPIEDHRSLAKCIIKIYEDNALRSELSDAARRSFKDEYDMKNNIKVLEELIWRHVEPISK